MSNKSYEGYCPAEMSEGLSWPKTYSGSESVTVTVPCPEDNDRNVTRECRNSVWSEFDSNLCLSFEDFAILVMVSSRENI